MDWRWRTISVAMIASCRLRFESESPMADDWLLLFITDGYSPSACRFPIATSNDRSAIAIASALCHCHCSLQRCKLPMAILITFCELLRVTDYHFEWTIYRWRDGRLSFTDGELSIVISITRGEEPIATSNFRLLVAHYMVPNNYHFAVPITDCRLQREWIR